MFSYPRKNMEINYHNPKGLPYKLLFIHGGPGMDDTYFFPFLKELESDFDIISYRHGQLGSNPDDLSREFAEVLKKIDTEQSHIIPFCHSFGARIFLEYLSLNKKAAFPAYIFCSWAYNNYWQESYYRRYPQELKSGDHVSNSQDYLVMMLHHIDKYFTEASHKTGKEVFEKINYNADLFSHVADSRMYKFDGKNTLINIKVPVLSIAGRVDRITDLNYIKLGENLINRVQSVIVDDASHFPFVEKPDVVINAIRSFAKKYIL